MIRRALLTIDLTEAVLEEALNASTDLVVAYHPPIFAPLKRHVQRDAGQRTLLRAAAAGIAPWSPHTALDAMPGGVNDWMLGLAGAVTGVAPITPRPDDPATGPGRIARLREPALLDALGAASGSDNPMEHGGKGDLCPGHAPDLDSCPTAGRRVYGSTWLYKVLRATRTPVP